jgi:hypothetical protein
MSQYDYLGRQAFNAIFGDAVVAERYPEVTLAWQYGQNLYDTTESVTGTGAVSYAASNATVSTGASTGTARLESKKALRYKPGFDGYAYFTTIFSPPEADTYQRAGLFTADNGYFIGYEGEQLQLTTRAGGVDTATPFTVRAGVDMTKFHIWRVSYGYLGSAPVVLERYTGLEGWIKVAAYDAVGELVAPHALNPSLPAALEVGRTSGSGAITLSAASMSVGRIGSGASIANERLFGARAEKTNLTSGNAILTIRNKTTFASVDNKVEAILQFVSAAIDTNKAGRVEAIVNATLGGTPSWTDVDAANSVMEYDTAGTTVTGGTFIGAIPLGSSGQDNLDVSNVKAALLPGDTLTLVGITTGTSPTFEGSISWREQF